MAAAASQMTSIAAELASMPAAEAAVITPESKYSVYEWHIDLGTYDRYVCMLSKSGK